MEILSLSQNSFKLRGKHASLVVDPLREDKIKTSGDAILLLTGNNNVINSVEGSRLLIESSGEYEVNGVKVSAYGTRTALSYVCNVDGVIVLIIHAKDLEIMHDKLPECHVAVVKVDDSLDSASLNAISPRVVLLYGANAHDSAKGFGKESQTASKFQTTLEKLPEEMQVVILG